MEINPETLEIEITGVEPIDGGVQVFARAWSDGVQIGFGVDGTVDVERFRIINPPILVDDPNGTIERITEANPERDIEYSVRRLREDPEQALIKAIVHTISVMKNVHGSSHIVSGKVGKTTSTFYPDASSGGSVNVDGMAYRQVTSETWSSLRGGNGTNASVTSTNDNVAWIRTNATADRYIGMLRSFYVFDTSSIPDSDTINSATLSLRGTSITNTYTGQSVALVAGTLANTNTVATSDYQGTVGNTTRLSSDIAISSWNTSGFNDFALNSSGLSHISKTGKTVFSGRMAEDVDNLPKTHPGAQQNAIANAYYADQTGTTDDPKLVVEHAGSASSSIKSIAGVAIADLKSLAGVAKADIKSVAGVSNVS